MTRDREDTTSAPAASGKPLEGRRNPRGDLDYVVAIESAAPRAHCRVVLRYVPDKLLVDSRSLTDYLNALAPLDEPAPERLAFALLDDINNEIVPRWLQIAVFAETDDMPAQTVIVVDRQPNWDNPAILSALPPLPLPSPVDADGAG